MPKFRALSLASATLLLLSGCSVFYPNWGATELPEEPSLAATPTESASDAVTAEPEPTDIEKEPSAEPEPTETEEPEIERVQTEVTIIMAIPEPDFGVLTVVAQIPGLSEAGGMCKMRFIGSDVERELEVNAEPSSDYTQCFPIEFPLSELPSGSGVVTVSYDSPFHFGISPATSVVIP
ncbi:MAG: hypothetical protein DCO81_00140 [Candidatus Aquiluna sp. XM-24bin5]|nr:MAG: hypothetical protein DCO81_00140 [Candidatus Aquiluna sp. XM-24bin5]